jgi:itaconyl-CoA hydratase
MMADGHFHTAGQGERMMHDARRTVTQQDNSWLTLLTLNTAPHFDLTTTNYERLGGVLMNSCITLGVIQGLCLPEFGNGMLPNRGFGEIRMTSPVFADDTLRAESEMLAIRHGEDDEVAMRVRHRGFTQNGEKVIEFDRTWVSPGAGGWAVEAARRRAAAPKLDANRRFSNAVVGPRFHDFEIGHRYDHGISRTISGEESIWISLLHLNSNRHYIDADFARKTGETNVIVDDTLVLSTVTGISVKHSSQNAIANLGWRNVEFHTPVIGGDTISSESEVIGKRLSTSRAGEGIVTVRTTGRNQRNEVVLSFDRAILFDAES